MEAFLSSNRARLVACVKLSPSESAQTERVVGRGSLQSGEFSRQFTVAISPRRRDFLAAGEHRQTVLRLQNDLTQFADCALATLRLRDEVGD